MTSRTRLSLLIAGLTSVCLLGWIALGFINPLINLLVGMVGFTGACASIWLAWSNGTDRLPETDHLLDRTFT